MSNINIGREKNNSLVPKWLKYFIIVVIVIGIFFRFTNLGLKASWRDESVTLMRIAGYTRAEVIEQAYDGRIHSVEELRQYQEIGSEKGVIDTIKSLAIEDS